ncbi:AAA family ATPase [Bifidobacterium pseudolongum]|uniref:AAA family ATPase n=1 Tax=Bifidobacterium pseudolongum TaxID=1694 RepID=UPI00101EB342|nr:AAA family ATPase [Bifidobacterium pseudolongum]RYQ03609.1 AAA domain-containing protein [Bifidobacterium pseudolongum subsp. globosum]
MTDISPALAASKLATFEYGQNHFIGNGVAHTAGGHAYDVDTGERIEEGMAINGSNLSDAQRAFIEKECAKIDGAKGRHIELESLEDVEIVPRKWLLPSFLPVGYVTIYAGYGGTGKTLFALWQCAQLTTGLSDGDWRDEPVDVIYIGREDGPAALKAHAVAAGIDLKHFHVLRTYDDTTGHDVEQSFRLPDDLDVLEDAVRDSGAKLIIIDPPESCIEGKLNDMRTARRALDPLAEFATRLDVCVLLIGHMSTSGRLTGSEGFRDIVRSKVDFARDEDAGDVVATLEKSQYTGNEGKSWAFKIATAEVLNKYGAAQLEPRVDPPTWQPTERKAVDLINAKLWRGRRDGTRSKTAEVADWLVELLENGPMLAADVLKAGAEHGFDENDVQNARRRARDPRILTTPDPNHTGRGRAMLWSLETQGTEQKE